MLNIWDEFSESQLFGGLCPPTPIAFCTNGNFATPLAINRFDSETVNTTSVIIFSLLLVVWTFLSAPRVKI